MPGPLLRSPELPAWADPNTQSVTDPLYKTLIKKAVGALGINDPNSMMMGSVSPMPMISIYEDKIARLGGNRAFNSAAEVMPERFRVALQEFAKKYPRVAAHMRPKLSALEEGALGRAEVPRGVITEPVDVHFSPQAEEVVNKPWFNSNGIKKASDLVTHEATHVAQGLSNSDLIDLYKAASVHGTGPGEAAIEGYARNPFEMTARRSEPFANAKRLFPVAPERTNAIDILRNRVNSPVGPLSHAGPFGQTPQAGLAGDYIRAILKDRDAYAWTPKK